MAYTVHNRILGALNPAGLERHVRRTTGFHSPEALRTALDQAVYLAEGGELTRAHAAAVAYHLPAVPRAWIAQRFAHVNAHEPGEARCNAYIRAFGFGTDMQTARAVIDGHAHDTFAWQLEAKIDERDARTHRAADTSKPIDDSPVARANADAAERNLTIRHLMGANDPPPPRTWTQAKSNVADRLEANADRGHALRNLEFNRGRETTRKEDLELAYDGNQAMDEATELINADGVATAYEQTQASPDAPA